MTQIDKNIFLETAWDIGCELMKTSIWHGDACTWQGYSIEPLNGQYLPVIKTFGSDVYSGTSGIALFLSALYSETKDPILLKTIQGCINQIKSNKDILLNHGFYSGKAGVASVFIKIGKDLERKDLIEEGINLLKSIPSTSIENHEVDLISGVAGTIPVLLDVFKEFNEKELLDKAIELGNLLCIKADKKDDVWSWATVPSKINLTGFSHGASGVALALFQLYIETGNKEFLKGAVSGFNYERTSFDASQQNWPDFRDDVGSNQTSSNVCSMAWCHGAPGITISRFRANQFMPDATYAQEMETALSTTTKSVYNTLMSNLTNTNFSLCHGIAGNSDILLDCGNEEHFKIAEAVGVAGINSYKKNGTSWPSGLNTNQYTPGLMMGVSGTGYFYLRLFNKEKHKSLLYASA